MAAWRSGVRADLVMDPGGLRDSGDHPVGVSTVDPLRDERGRCDHRVQSSGILLRRRFGLRVANEHGRPALRAGMAHRPGGIDGAGPWRLFAPCWLCR
jgi:hypothetical protein